MGPRCRQPCAGPVEGLGQRERPRRALPWPGAALTARHLLWLLSSSAEILYLQGTEVCTSRSWILFFSGSSAQPCRAAPWALRAGAESAQRRLFLKGVKAFCLVLVTDGKKVPRDSDAASIPAPGDSAGAAGGGFSGRSMTLSLLAGVGSVISAGAAVPGDTGPAQPWPKPSLLPPLWGFFCCCFKPQLP